MRHTYTSILLAACVGLTTNLQAGEIGPEIIIYEQEAKTIEETRLNGQIVLVEVKPDDAPRFQLVSSEGRGEFENSNIEDVNHLKIPQWVLTEW